MKKKTIIIRLYDSEPDFHYPLLEIYENKKNLFYFTLKEYRKNNEEDYNFDDFITELNKKKILKNVIFEDETIYF